MNVALVCPIHRGALRPCRSGLEATCCGAFFPVTEGIHVLLPLETDRRTLLERDWSIRSEKAEPLAFYNQTCDHAHFCRESLGELRGEIEAWMRRTGTHGLVLEIGSGRGALQGLGADYVALDYSLTALKTYVDPKHQRICATAGALPFPCDAFDFVFSVATLEHVPEPNRAFEEISRVLRPGGVAYVLPAWHCIQDNCEGIPVRSYAELTWWQAARKATLPVRQSLPYKALTSLPRRVARRAAWQLRGAHPTQLQYGRLRPDYSHFWMSDSDAVARLDSHEGCLFFRSRNFDVLQPGNSAWAQLMARHEAVVIRKPQGVGGGETLPTPGPLPAPPPSPQP